MDGGGRQLHLTTQLTIFASELTASDREQLAEVLGDDLSG